MKDILEIIDDKFEIGLREFSSGKNSLRSSRQPLGDFYAEIIALDSDAGPNSRCLLTRQGLGSPSIRINGLTILSWGIEIPRTKGDKRVFEDLPTDAIQGNIFCLGTLEEHLIIRGDIRPDWLTLDGLSYALSGMRVATNIPLPNL